MKTIPLTQGYETIVDDEDYEELSKYKWHVGGVKGYTKYAQRKIRINGKRTSISMHVVILASPLGFEVDHKDGNGLNNTKENLRSVKHSDNCKNRKKRKDSTQTFKGIRKRKNGTWRARIYSNGNKIIIGSFQNEFDAASAYDRAAIKYHGEFAKTNF